MGKEFERFDKKFKKEVKESLYQRNILEAILFSSTTEDSFELPTIKEFILSEVINGTIKYAKGKAGKLNYQYFRHGKINAFEKEITEYFQEEISKTNRHINPKIRKSIIDMTKYDWVNVPGPMGGDSYPTCGLYDHIHDPIFGVGGISDEMNLRSTFSLSAKIISKIKNKTFPSLSNAERKSVEGIGKSMREFVDRDLKYIKENYHW